MKKTLDINAILALPENKGYSMRGADMGRMRKAGEPSKLHLQKLRMSSDGCYDTGGAYWGSGQPLFCAFSEDGTTRVFTRAKSRAEAKAIIADDLGDDFTFYR